MNECCETEPPSRNPFRHWTCKISSLWGSATLNQAGHWNLLPSLYLEAVKRGWKTHISLFSRTGWQEGHWSDLTSVRPFHCSRRVVFTLNQTFPPLPLAARPGSINTGLIHFLHSLLQLDRWSMKAGTWECSSKQLVCAGKCDTVYRLQPSFACGDDWQWELLTQQKDFSSRVNELIFHSYHLELVLYFT